MALPQCDQGTALRLYWRSGAQWFTQFATRKDVVNVAEGSAGWDFCRRVEALVLGKRFSLHAILFNARSDDGSDHTTDYPDIPCLNPIPPEIFAPFPAPRLFSEVLLEEAMAYALKAAEKSGQSVSLAMAYLKEHVLADSQFGEIHQALKTRLQK